MKPGLSRLLLLCPLLSLLVGCSDDEISRPTEVVAPEEWNAVLALAADGDDVYAARMTRLDVHAADGTHRTIAGIAYADCPEDDDRWSATILDRGYPSFLVHRGRALLANPFCGLWSVDLTSGERTPLLVGPFGEETRWGGAPNARWHAQLPISFAPLGDDLAVCLSIDRGRERFAKTTSEPDRIEVWRVGIDGSAKEKLAALDPRDEACTHVLADGDKLFVATDHAIYRLEPATKSLTVVTTDAGTSFGLGLWGLTQDAEHLYLLRESALERVHKGGSERTVLLERPPPFGFSRLAIATDGAHVYWLEDRDVLRIPVGGGNVEKMVEGDEDFGVFPSSLAITGSHVFYQRAKRVDAHSVTDEETGEVIDDVTLHFAIERVAK